MQRSWLHLQSSLCFRKPIIRMSDPLNLANYSSIRRVPTLPRLPIPPLRNTLDKYLKSIEPFLCEDAANGGLPFTEALQKRIIWAEEFENGLGQICQKRLVDLDKTSPYNWLDDNFWLKKIYHEWRAPLLINSNWWLIFENDKVIPRSVIEGRDYKTVAGISAWQIRRAAWLTRRIIEFKERVDSQELYPDTTRTGLWIRNTVPKIFNICRVPAQGCDYFSDPDFSTPASQKILLMLHDWLYTIDVYDLNGRCIGFEEIEKRMRQVVLDVRQRLETGDSATPIGILTSDNRKLWAQHHSYLTNLSSLNRETLRTIHSCLFSVCLDHYTLISTDTSAHAFADSEVDSHLHNVRSGCNGRNRWFDKPITLIVESNSRAGMMGEHSPCDALIPSIVADYALTEQLDGTVPNFDTIDDLTGSISYIGWERLQWDVDDFIQNMCLEAESRAKEHIHNSDDTILCFKEFGGDWIKSTGFSPDAIVQMALQLSWYALTKTFTATYETALTRLFLHGRTETIRSLTTASRKFVLAMNDPTVGLHDRRKYLRQATLAHTTLSREAATGKGIDRHLLGLQQVLHENESCKLFDDDIFSRSQEWKLSTSGLSSGERFRGTGFGSSYPDGYGMNYAIGPEMITFGVETKRTSVDTSTSEFCHSLVASLKALQQLCSFNETDQVVDGSDVLQFARL